MSATYEEGRFDDTNTPNKVLIEDMFTNIAGEQMASDALCLCGPNYRRHSKNIIKRITTAPNAVFAIAEIIPSTRAIIRKEMRICPITDEYSKQRFTRGAKKGSPKGLPTIYKDVIDIKRSFRFEDLDFTGSWKNTLPLLINRLTKQCKDKRKNRLKCLIGTVCERSGKREAGGPEVSFRSINTLLSVLDAELEGFNGVSGGFSTENKQCNSKNVESECECAKAYKYIQQPNWKKRGRVEQLRAYKYRDHISMFTFMIMYY